MTIHIMRGLLRRGRLASTAFVLAGVTLAGCGATDTLLETEDPDIINPGNVQSSEGAEALRIGAIGRLRSMTGSSESTWLFGGLLADEWSTSSTFVQNDETDTRRIKEDNSSIRDMFYAQNRTRTAANQAIAALREFRPTPQWNIAEMYFARGMAEMQIAQDFCSGIPLSDGSGTELVHSPPLSRTEILNHAIASFDTGMTLSAGFTDATAINIHRAARVGKARALIGLDRHAEAVALVPQGTAAGQIPNNYAYDVTFSTTGGTNTIWSQGASQRRYTVGDSLEGNSRNLLVKNVIPFFSAADPRLPVIYTTQNSGKDTVKAQDGLTFSRTTRLYGQLTSLPIMNGIDARLIEAEGRLKAKDYPAMVAILNALRDTSRVLTPASLVSGVSYGVTVPRMSLLAVPTSDDAAIDMYFREKAFWTFGRGQRLGDMRRMMKYYGRAQASVFPVGEHYRGGTYGTDIALPVPAAERNNPLFQDFVRPSGDACNNG